jgi:prostaglandin-endoperoxide synthase 2
MMLSALIRSRSLRRLLVWASSIPWLGAWINRSITNQLASSATPRPRPFSLWSPVAVAKGGPSGPVSDYTSWPALTDRRFSARHLPPACEGWIAALPDDTPAGPGNWGPITSLFAKGKAMQTDRSSVLFAFFAQWFTDSVLRTDPDDRRKNTSNHDVDLCQIYGLYEHEARCLRSHSGGRLSSQIINGEEYPDYLGERNEAGEWQIKAKYSCVDSEGHVIPEKGLYPHGNTEWIKSSLDKSFPPGTLTTAQRNARLDKLYATGLERGNSSVGYVALSTVFLREHNRICCVLSSLPDLDWKDDDERLFQTARMINTCLLLKLTIEDYINHIAGDSLFRFDPSFAEGQPWYRSNWIALEFNLLYRWHGLVPDHLIVNGVTVNQSSYRWNNELLEAEGLASIVSNASAQAAGRINLENSPDFLMGAEYQAIKMGRDFRLQGYNEYRQNFGLAKLKDFTELTKNDSLRQRLEALYGHIDKLELVVGLFAEDPQPGALFGSLMLTMVAYDAFTQIYTNPLLSTAIYTAETLTAYGLELINGTSSIDDLVRRNLPADCSLLARLGV